MFLQVKSLTKCYGEGDNRVKVLDSISFDIEKGKICTLLGPSGSGKSTLLNAVGGLEKIDGGEIVIDGFVFQFYNLIPDLSVRENIEVGAAICSDTLNLKELIDALGLTEHQDKLPNQLSGGQQQRCAIGRALIKKPNLLVCDEPTGALDYKTSKEILSLISKINKEYGTTIIIATHNEAISAIAHRTIRLRDGKIHKDTVNSNVIDAALIEW